MLNKSKCKLRAMSEEDLSLVLAWRNAETIRTNMYNDHIISMDEHRKWFTRVKGDPAYRLLIFEYQGTPIGFININQIDIKNNRCHWGFYLAESYAGHGYGLSLGYYGLNYVFIDLKIHKLCSEVFSFNHSSLKFHEKLGFFREGLFKAHILKNGKYEDIICFAIFQDDWFKISTKIAEVCFEKEI